MAILEPKEPKTTAEKLEVRARQLAEVEQKVDRVVAAASHRLDIGVVMILQVLVTVGEIYRGQLEAEASAQDHAMMNSIHQLGLAAVLEGEPLELSNMIVQQYYADHREITTFDALGSIGRDLSSIVALKSVVALYKRKLKLEAAAAPKQETAS